MQRPVLLYDGDCGFCRRWVERWRTATGERVEYAASQSAATRFPHVSEKQLHDSIVLVEPDGTTTFAAEAVFRALAYAPRGGKTRWAYAHVPGFGALCDAAYGVVARNRVFFSRVQRALWGNDVHPPRHGLVRWSLLRGLGVVYLIAFSSLWVQIEGLVGSRGILPMGPWFDAILAQTTDPPLLQIPTLLWLDSSDAALHAVSACGVLAALALIVNLAPGPAAVVAWLCYLSLYTVGRVFLSFQWDILLLETGVIAALWAPWRLRPGVAEPASRAPLWLARWLVFRLMLLSGLVKLLSGDPAWRDLTAMSYHYETQPLPAWTSWFAHQLPLAAHRASTAGTFVIELVLPFLIFAPRRLRLLAFAAFVALQLMIGLTGNYGFFNLLTAVACLALLDDAAIERWWPRRQTPDTMAGSRSVARTAVRAGSFAVASYLFVLSGANMVGRVRGYDGVPVSLRGALSYVGSLHLTSNYGLFAVMTKKRPEIVVEGSRDGVVWEPYEFRWKPGDPARRPAFVQPHMPRLDWQMWFAALGSHRQSPWFAAFLRRLLEGSPEVLALLARDPFEGRPPEFVRATLYDYRFTRLGAPEAEGAWWTRRDPQPYTPVMRRPPPAPGG